MRLRTALTAATAAFALALSAAGSSAAATGEFRYVTLDLNNVQIQHVLDDPQSRECIDLEGTGNLPALLGRNLTTSVATVFQDAACDGDTFWTVSPGAFVPVTARFRSVVFS
ncbi:hypothetical protein [Streptomyces erythrochromogenes]|uniref:hypothetical protein n=1 Tax=Streptomyces erythrochromogenes TaxID=285574 RepID=UPI0037F608DE